MNILTILGTAFVAMFFTWGMYLAVMNLIQAKSRLTLAAKCFAYPLAFIGVIMDVLLNITVCTVLFLELPSIQQLLLTARLQKHLDEMEAGTGSKWRQSIALWICVNLLDSFDSRGYHCKKLKEPNK